MKIIIDKSDLTNITIDVEKWTRHSKEQFEVFLTHGNIYFNLYNNNKPIIGLNSAKYVGYFNGKFRFTYTIDEDDNLPIGQYHGHFVVDFPFKDKMLVFKKDIFNVPKSDFILNIT
jgi:hypothetical protein